MLGDPLSQLLYAKARHAAGYGFLPIVPRVPPQVPGGYPGPHPGPQQWPPQPQPQPQPLPSDIAYYIRSRLSQGLPVGPDYSWDAHDAPPGAHIMPRPNI